MAAQGLLGRTLHNILAEGNVVELGQHLEASHGLLQSTNARDHWNATTFPGPLAFLGLDQGTQSDIITPLPLGLRGE